MTKSQTEFFKMLDRKIDEVCVIPLPPCVHVVVLFQVSWLQVLLLLLQVLCGIKVINKELSFPFLWQHKIVSLKGDWHGGGEKTKQIGTFNRKIFLLIVGLWTLGACMVWVLCLGPGLHITFNLQTWPQSECKKGFMICRLKGYFQVLGCEVKLYRTTT